MKVTIFESYSDPELQEAQAEATVAAGQVSQLPPETVMKAFDRLRRLHLDRGQLCQALQCGDNLSSLAQSASIPILHLVGLRWMSETYLDCQMPLDAVRVGNWALAFAKDQGWPQVRSSLEAHLSLAYTRSGHALQGQLLAVSAMASLEEAKSEWAERTALLALASATAAARQYKRAISLLELIASEPDNSWKAEVQAEMGVCLLQLGDREAGLAMLGGAVATAVELARAPTAIGALHRLAAEHAKADLEQARELWDLALEMLDSQVAKLSIEEFRITMLERHAAVFEAAGAAAYRASNQGEAWRIAERLRARVLVRQLRNRRLVRVWFDNRAEQREYRKSSAELARTSALLSKERGRNILRGVKLRNLEDAYQAARRSKSGLQRRIGARRMSELTDEVPGLNSRRILSEAELGDEEVVSIGRLQESLDAATCLVQFFVTDDSVLSFCVSAEGFESHASALPRLTLNALVDEVLSCVDKVAACSTLDVPSMNEAYAKPVVALCAALFEPFSSTIEGKARVCIVSDGPLYRLPFGLLRLAGPLLDREVVLLWSASMWSALMSRPPCKLGSRVVAFANPQPRIAPLPHSEDEVRAIRSVLPHASIWLGHAATDSAFRAAVRGADLVHVACHATFDRTYPLLSELLLAPDKSEGTKGGLDAFEIQMLELDAGLVVLSCCETGLGGTSTAAELMGLVRSFLVAGAASVVASLWRVDDRATAKLMRAFYEALVQPGCSSKAAALARAQDVMRRSENHADPYFWAGFQLFGDFRIEAGPLTGETSS